MGKLEKPKIKSFKDSDSRTSVQLYLSRHMAFQHIVGFSVNKFFFMSKLFSL